MLTPLYSFAEGVLAITVDASEAMAFGTPAESTVSPLCTECVTGSTSLGATTGRDRPLSPKDSVVAVPDAPIRATRLLKVLSERCCVPELQWGVASRKQPRRAGAAASIDH